MDCIDAAKKAVSKVSDILGQCEENELAVLEAFYEEFSNVVECWKMRIEELNEDGES